MRLDEELSVSRMTIREALIQLAFHSLGAHRGLQFRIRSRILTSHKEHGEIVEAILASDPNLAARPQARHCSSELFSYLAAAIANLDGHANLQG